MINQGAMDHAEALCAEVRRTMFGVEEITRFSIIALYTGGHVLLEGNPGLGKTELVKSLARALRLPFGRIQFTPDLMPADITGTYAPDMSADMSRPVMAFQPGPVFTSLLLADEVNRATPKTQSAMLEAMAEKQVTVLGERRELPRPFMVLATQNPIDHEGTYALPKAQSDRFMFMLDMPVPGRGVLQQILRKTAGVVSGSEGMETGGIVSGLVADETASVSLYERLLDMVPSVVPAPSVEMHVANVYLATNGRSEEMVDVSAKQRDKAAKLVDEYLDYGLGPRAATALLLGAKAWALFFRAEATGADGEDLARVMLPVLRHRLQLQFGWEEGFAAARKMPVGRHLLERYLVDLCEATAPDDWRKGEYTGVFERGMVGALHAQGISW